MLVTDDEAAGCYNPLLCEAAPARPMTQSFSRPTPGIDADMLSARLTTLI